LPESIFDLKGTFDKDKDLIRLALSLPMATRYSLMDVALFRCESRAGIKTQSQNNGITQIEIIIFQKVFTR